jgi:hypothetical protein
MERPNLAGRVIVSPKTHPPVMGSYTTAPRGEVVWFVVVRPVSHVLAKPKCKVTLKRYIYENGLENLVVEGEHTCGKPLGTFAGPVDLYDEAMLYVDEVCSFT